jgi:Sec-independent protein secretion pathway component TatC
MREFYMANIVASVLPRHERAMPFLAHLEELRRRIIFSILEILVGFLSAGRSRIDCSV